MFASDQAAQPRIDGGSAAAAAPHTGTGWRPSQAAGRPAYLLVEPSHYDVSYAINPWMQPGLWAEDPALHRAEAGRAFEALCQALREAGGVPEVADGAAGLPDMVFPANGAVVLDGRALLARFRYPQRQGEEAAFERVFARLQAQGVVREVAHLPGGCLQEGAGDCLWDRTRRLAWTGFGPRSTPDSPDVLADHFGIEIRRLELATPRFYHLDTCFCALPRGEVLFYPPAFTEAGLRLIHEAVEPDQRLEASDEDAAAFCVNAVALGEKVVMANPPDRLRARLAERGYEVLGVDLAPFILSGGGAYCMTLRLDLVTNPGAA